jgi:CheY-like chemotaxis protein
VTKKDKILVIDDVVELIDMYKIMFEMKGYEVETAKD